MLRTTGLGSMIFGSFSANRREIQSRRDAVPGARPQKRLPPSHAVSLFCQSHPGFSCFLPPVFSWRGAPVTPRPWDFPGKEDVHRKPFPGCRRDGPANLERPATALVLHGMPQEVSTGGLPRRSAALMRRAEVIRDHPECEQRTREAEEHVRQAPGGSSSSASGDEGHSGDELRYQLFYAESGSWRRRTSALTNRAACTRSAALSMPTMPVADPSAVRQATGRRGAGIGWKERGIRAQPGGRLVGGGALRTRRRMTW
jgi:hypothetical protein